MARLRKWAVHLLLVEASLCAYCASGRADLATTGDELLVYDANQTIVDQASAQAASGLVAPGVQDTATPGNMSMPLLFIEPGQGFQPTRPIPVVLEQLNLLLQGGLLTDNVIGVNQTTHKLAFWSDGDPSSPTDMLAAFQVFGIGSLWNTVLVEVKPTTPVDVSAYVNLPLSASFLSDGGVPEPSSVVIWLLLGTGGLVAAWWRRRRTALSASVTAD